MISEKLFVVVYLLVFLPCRYAQGVNRLMNNGNIGLQLFDEEHRVFKRSANQDTVRMEARIEEYSFQLVLLDDTFHPFYCSLIMLTSSWAVLPDHCGMYVEKEMKKNKKYKVLSAMQQLSDQNSLQLEYNSSVEIEKIIHHPEYDPIVSQNNIALLKFKTPLASKPNGIQLKPACLIEFEDENTKEYDDLDIIGYGRSTQRQFIHLLKANVKDVSFGGKIGFLSNLFQIEIKVLNLDGLCFQKDGMALIHNVGSGKKIKRYVLGINNRKVDKTSAGHCDEKLSGKKIVFTRLSQYKNWIKNTIDESHELCIRDVIYVNQ